MENFLSDIGKFIVGPSRGEMDAERLRARNAVIGPDQKELAEKYLKQGGDEVLGEFEGTPGYDRIQQMYDAKERKKMPFGPPVENKGTKDKTVKIGKSGFELMKPKERIFNEIMAKPPEKRTKAEQSVIYKIGGVKVGNKVGPTKPEHFDFLFGKAEDETKAAMIEVMSDEMSKANKSEDEILYESENISKSTLGFAEYAEKLPDIIQRYYPDLLPERVKEIADKYIKKTAPRVVPDAETGTEIIFPEEVKTKKQGFEYLVAEGWDTRKAALKIKEMAGKGQMSK